MLVNKCAAKHGIDVDIQMVESGKKLLFCSETKYADTDLIYIGYHLPDLNGMETAKRLRHSGYIGDIVFITADPTHADEGYSVDALAYLVAESDGLNAKETGKEFEEIFLKAWKHCQKRNREIMTFSYHGEHCNIPVDDIIYFEVLKHTVTVHYYKDKENKRFDFYSTLSKVEDWMANRGFLRTHKSYLVASKHIYKQAPHQIEMSNGDVLPIGRSFK
jgi:DNA-binding LytR/AlgR family response regulator